MYSKLKFKAYATRNLNVVEQRFKEQIGRKPGVYVIRQAWKEEVFGTKENMDKILVSRFAGFASVSVPLFLKREQIETLDAIKNMSKVPDPPAPRRAFSIETSFTRHCNYCGRMYGTDPQNPVTHCGAPLCAEEHREQIASLADVKKHSRDIKNKHGMNESQEQKTNDQNKTPDFSLDDPMYSSLRGWVYLIKSENGLYKIGRSNDIERRFCQFRSQCPVDLYLEHTIYSVNYFRAEEHLHNEFHVQVHHGEWFQLSESDVEWIMKLKDHDLDMV